jgi:hypothetical protein
MRNLPLRVVDAWFMGIPFQGHRVPEKYSKSKRLPPLPGVDGIVIMTGAARLPGGPGFLSSLKKEKEL